MRRAPAAFLGRCRFPPMHPMNVVILAAGQGKRMRSDLPKVLHPLAGKPLLAHVLDTARELGAAKICVVYGHGGEQVRAALDAADLAWVQQEPQLGTGHAVLQALPHLDPDRSPTLVLYGDVPLIARRHPAAPDRGGRRRQLGAADRASRRSARLRPHRPRRRQGHAHRRGEGCRRCRARDPRDQHRHPRRARPRRWRAGCRSWATATPRASTT